MQQNKIRELRLAHKMTAEQLGKQVGVSGPQITRLEKSQRGLSLPMAEKFAEVFDVNVTQVLGITGEPQPREAAFGFAEDVSVYEPEPADLVAAMLKKNTNLFAYRVKKSALDEIGITDGDILLIDISATSVEDMKPMQAVIAQAYDPGDLLKAVTILRQFVPPSMLITNSKFNNSTPVNLATDDVHVKGVVTYVHRQMAGN